MTIIEKIKALFALNKLVNVEITEAKRMDGSKPGYKTTEFYMNLAVQIGIFWAAIRGLVPPKQAAIIETVGVAIYTIARTIIKVIQDAQATEVVAGAPQS